MQVPHVRSKQMKQKEKHKTIFRDSMEKRKAELWTIQNDPVTSVGDAN